VRCGLNLELNPKPLNPSELAVAMATYFLATTASVAGEVVDSRTALGHVCVHMCVES
jgi:hypothetical protein